MHNVDTAIEFYVGRLGFALNMRYEEDGRARVAGVSRGEGCGLLLTDQWPERVGKGILYTGLPEDEFARLRLEWAAAGIEAKSGNWGQEMLIVTDPDGNQFYFPLPAGSRPA